MGPGWGRCRSHYRGCSAAAGGAAEVFARGGGAFIIAAPVVLMTVVLALGEETEAGTLEAICR